MRHIVTGYHGTDAGSAASIDGGEFKPGEKGWFGPGIYFWEQDKGRALRWADKVVKAPLPAVVQAELNLSNQVLDLTVESQAKAYEKFISDLKVNFPQQYTKAFVAAKESDNFADSVWVALYRKALAAGQTPRRVDSLRAVVLEASGYTGTMLATAAHLKDANGRVARSRVVTKIAIMVVVYDAALISNVSISPH